MKLILICPECGCSDWKRNEEEGSFVCASCGQEFYPEDMPASAEEPAMKDWEKLYMASKRLAMNDRDGAKALTDEVFGSSPAFSDDIYWQGIKDFQRWDWYQVPADFRDWAGEELVKRYKDIMSHAGTFRECKALLRWCALCLEAAFRSMEDSYDGDPDTASFVKAMMAGTDPDLIMNYFYARSLYVDECDEGYYLADHDGNPDSGEVYKTCKEADEERSKQIMKAKEKIFEGKGENS